MTTPDIDYDKALGVVAPRFKLLEKTEDDVVWAALPKLDQEVLTQLKDHDEFEPGLVNMTKALGDMQKEAGKFLAGWHEAQERVKTAKELLDRYNLAQTVDAYGEQLATHGDLHAAHVAQFAEQKKINEGVQETGPRAVPQLVAHVAAQTGAVARQGPRAHERVAGAGVRGRDGEVAPLRAARQEGRAGQGAPRCQVQGLGNGRRREADGVARRPPRVSLYASRAAAVRAVIPHLPKSQS